MSQFYKKINYLLIIVCLPFCLNAQSVLYVYGDVSADGKIPSGEQEPFHQMRLNDTDILGMSQFLEALEEVNLNVREIYDQELILNSKTLKTVDVLILASNQRVFSKEEAEVVRVWVKKGGGLVVWSDSGFGGEYKLVGVDNPTGRISDNSITEQFGMHFLTDNGAGNYLVQNYTEDHFLNNFNKNGGIRFRGEGVSFIRISKPAKMLANAQDGGLGGKLIVNDNDGVFNAKTDASLAITEIGKGRVIGLFDRNLFWNAGAGTRLSHSDNREFTQRLMLFAAGITDSKRIPVQTSKNAKEINTPPIIEISQKLSKDGKSLSIVTVITDNDADGIDAEISWKQVKGPSDVIFENNNPNTLTPTIELPEKGMYRFEASIKDGEFDFRRSIEVIRK